MRAGRRPSARFGHAQRGAVGLRRIGGGEDQVLVLALGQAAQALDRAGERELGPAEALDEVAAPRGAEHLQVRELAVEAREAAGDALGEHRLAGDDPVALEHQLGLGAQPRALRGGVAEQRLGQRPAALDRLLGGVAARGEAAARAPTRSRPRLRRRARSGAKASLVTSPAQTRSQSAACSSSRSRRRAR